MSATRTLVEIGERIVAAATVRDEAGGMRTATAPLPEGYASMSDEARAKAVQEALSKCGVRDRKFALVLPRRRALLREFDLPPGEPEEVRRMIHYQMERELPVAIEEVYSSYATAVKREGGIRVRVAAVPKNVLDPILSILALSGYRPSRVYVSCFGLASWARGREGSSAVVALSDGHAEIVVSSGGEYVYSRSAPLRERSGDCVAMEVRRTLLSYAAAFPDGNLDSVLLAAGGKEAEALAREMSGSLERPVDTLDRDLVPEAAGAAGVGLATLRSPESIPDVLNPPVVRRKFRITRTYALAGLAVFFVLALFIGGQVVLAERENELKNLKGEMDRLKPRVDAAREVLERTRLVREWDDLRYPWIDLLADLSDRIDHSRIYIISVSFGERGTVRMIGKSKHEAAVHNLLASLGESRYFEEVSFRGRDRNSDRSDYRLDFIIEGRLEGFEKERKKRKSGGRR